MSLMCDLLMLKQLYHSSAECIVKQAFVTVTTFAEHEGKASKGNQSTRPFLAQQKRPCLYVEMAGLLFSKSLLQQFILYRHLCRHLLKTTVFLRRLFRMCSMIPHCWVIWVKA